MNEEGVRSAIKQARKLAGEIPEVEYRQVAFDALLQHYLMATPDSDGTVAGQPFEAAEAPAGQPIPEPHTVKTGSRDEQAIWAVMTLVSRHEEATCAAIARIVKDELGHTPESIGNLSYRLKQLTPKYVNRVKSGKAYVYKPTREAPTIFGKTDRA